MLNKGIRWRIGDDSSMYIYIHPWLRDSNNFYIENPSILGLADLTAKDLMIPGSHEWDIELILNFFISRDIAQISSIPLCYSNKDDILI